MAGNGEDPQVQAHSETPHEDVAITQNSCVQVLSSPASFPSAVTVTSSEHDRVLEVTNKIADAINAVSEVRSNLYISSFDPSLHNFEAWCDKVEYARSSNGWDDRECLARIGNCLKGDARIWLNEWVTNDRTWQNFKNQFKALCPRRVDIADILFNVMNTNSDSYPTYAEYARRSLLRLQIVSGLSEELIVAIVIRGITDPQIRAAATNANILSQNLINFLSIYTKLSPSTTNQQVVRNSKMNEEGSKTIIKKRESTDGKIKCFNFSALGHKHFQCPKIMSSNISSASTSVTPSTSSEKKKKNLVLIARSRDITLTIVLLNS
ncbi:PREDICTED: uncharacterized protein LOC106105849 [Papilio polytes]|uniref:uncharacterized protein LOC106105849 n=1 Tax=Papilio polytes TaxID=76194 RepID=UPI0006768E6F|nr:PREDICTED: uncharacterized protein LOC106105849 [Papilio polytes]